jgi:hypothetical protein
MNVSASQPALLIDLPDYFLLTDAAAFPFADVSGLSSPAEFLEGMEATTPHTAIITIILPDIFAIRCADPAFGKLSN